jgi:CBS domain containing-hemolysin-like protein
MDKVKNQKIQKQVERWDLFARLTPTLFLLTSLFLVVFDVVPLEYAFYIGLTGFAITAVSWWWWAIFTIRYLIIILSRASSNLTDVNNEIKIVKKELEDLKDER